MGIEGWNKRSTITYPSSIIDGDLTDFPLLLTSANINACVWANAQTSGDDLRITTDAEGTIEVPIQVVDFDTSTSACEIWFKTDVVSASDNLFYLWCGNSSATMPASDSTYGSEAVWNSGFKDVHHMDEESGNLLDSTDNSTTYTVSGDLPTSIDGIIGKGQDFNGTDDRADANPLTLANMTVEFWMKTSQSFTAGTGQWYTKDPSIIDAEVGGAYVDWGIVGGNSSKIGFGVGLSDQTIYSSATVNDDTFHYVTCIWTDGTKMQIYVDGEGDTLSTSSIPSGSRTPRYALGVDPQAVNGWYDGILDEVRISNVVRTDEWISTSYNVVNDTDSVSGSSCTNFGVVSGSLDIPNVNIDGTGSRGQSGIGTLEILNATIDGTGTRGQSGIGTLDIPNVNIDGTGSRGQSGISISATGSLEIPLITIDGTGTSTIVIQPEDLLEEQLVGEPKIDDWAYDISKGPTVVGEVLNEDAINVSIENILSTLRGERLFSPYFGSTLPLQVFEQIDVSIAENLLDELLDAIALWEDRITIIKSEIELNILTNENTLTLLIPYIINRNGLTGRFSRKIVL
jgi:phage baseplate assembly protein W